MVVNVTDPDLAIHPEFHHTHPIEGHLEQGDVLFLPKAWWHEFHSVTDDTASLTTWTGVNQEHSFVVLWDVIEEVRDTPTVL